MFRSSIAALLVVGACAGSDAPQPALDTPDPVGAAATGDSAWTAGDVTLAGRILTVDGGMITLPRAFTVEIEPATLTDTQTVTLSLMDSVGDGDFRAVNSPARRPPWIGRVTFARTCPPKPVHVRAVVPPAYRGTDSLHVIPHVRIAMPDSFRAVGEHALLDHGTVVQFVIPEELFSSRHRTDGRCEALFALPLGS